RWWGPVWAPGVGWLGRRGWWSCWVRWGTLVCGLGFHPFSASPTEPSDPRLVTRLAAGASRDARRSSGVETSTGGTFPHERSAAGPDQPQPRRIGVVGGELLTVVQWADLHPGEAVPPVRVPGQERPVQIGGDGTPWVAEFAVA